MKIRLLTMAEKEVDEAVSWYQEQTEDQSVNVLDELDRTVQVVTTYPLLAAEIEPKFASFCPSLSVYAIDGETIVVIAVAHQHRKPHYWVHRLNG